ncbi:uroporphyrinogen decarboxylase family protein [Oceanispirochaeta sp.]|jgi:hypothetical protein|uniref:uroporphyrinogen decarboxylase family protein n=1 Tax=Oceanispirochaeta sp. TaxID=2035350 RepID=UPI002621071B|nr:uroporphyrinogen decarboxylase family protein [Oceanispirochaeta sp.]MDA3957096.1 hypothetical protein [Oceanispirochaeta sp.]
MTKFDAFFASVYWNRYAGIDFTQKSLGDPAIQIEHQRRRQLHCIEKWEILGIPICLADKQNAGTIPAVVSGYGVATISMIFGCKGIFTEGLDPYAESLNLTDKAIMALTPQTDYSRNPVMQDLESQAAWLVKTHGKACININMQSVPNIAFKLRGDQLMFDFYDNPEIVHKLLDYVQQSWINIRSYISRINEKNHCPDDGGMISLDNCTVALISPDIYRTYFLPYDIKTAARYSSIYGVHHCGANMHLFSDYYGQLGEGIWFDIGYGSDVKSCMSSLKTGEKMPFWSVRYGPAKLRSADPEEIRRERDVLAACGVDTVLCVGVDPDTPDENLQALLIP